MSRENVAKIIETSKLPYQHGRWSEFCIRNGLSKDAVFHWRKKLGLPLNTLSTFARPYAADVTCVTETSVTVQSGRSI